MNVLTIDPSVKLAWNIANADACLSGFTNIEPVHFLYAILKIVDDVYSQDAVLIGIHVDASYLSPQVHEIREFTKLSDDEITRIRRSIHKALHMEGERIPIISLHRSLRLKDIFNHAEKIAVQTNSATLNIVHIAKAIFIFPSTDVSSYLSMKTSEKPSLTWETSVNNFVDEYKLASITLVFTDMIGSTSIKRKYGDIESARIFRTHDKLIRTELLKYPQSKVIKTIGDSFLVAFAKMSDAVGFAIFIQSALRNHHEFLQIPLKVRIGIYAGEILERVKSGSGQSDPIFGMTIDLTSRIMSLASGNQILTDSGIYRQVSSELPYGQPIGLGDIEWRCHGSYKLKGLETTPLEIYEVGEKGKALFERPESAEKAERID
ncbi:adenylate/guanylate cyclase domain-containing protein [Candidatus Magnetominusculus xianensis]|uniref:Adenylate cyclase n=1 Tax=Candidatus Magnetominusculus xianensis TaxID=1748249 RepID=A0ABR5SJY5_9BACT|nr:adenylate/guanylate cyclase domain-containing protein [Candidatus Magnetominusculus xianensis]KWT95151.1 adenylate cyclase [Candidatus Magnetominusculus xianensis]MBF0402798.1 adenylate/guanylate cyclase domain-containing protein [Nitrospirota bacterium]